MRLSALLVSLLLTSALLSACAPREPVISADAADEIRDALGYVLAPTYLPKGFEFIMGGPITMSLPPEVPPDFETLAGIALLYSDSPERQEHGVMVHFPLPWPLDLSEIPGLETPEDAISEIEARGRTASLVRGSWPEAVLRAYSENQEAPADATWDYDISLELFFAFDLPDDRTIAIVLAAHSNPSEWISAKELVRIAESIVVVD